MTVVYRCEYQEIFNRHPGPPIVITIRRLVRRCNYEPYFADVKTEASGCGGCWDSSSVFPAILRLELAVISCTNSKLPQHYLLSPVKSFLQPQMWK